MITSMQKVSAGRVERVTISVPADLFARGEAERRQLGLSRSAYVRELYRSRLDALELQERLARYGAAYRSHPSDPAEDALVEAGAEAMLEDDASQT